MVNGLQTSTKTPNPLDFPSQTTPMKKSGQVDHPPTSFTYRSELPFSELCHDLFLSLRATEGSAATSLFPNF